MRLLRKVIFVVGLLVAGASLALFARFLLTQGVERASWWVSVAGFFVTVSGVAIAVYAWRRPVPPPGSGNGSEVSGGTAGVGPVAGDGGFAAGDVRMEARDQAVVAGVVQGSVSTANPHRPGPASA
ncbi:hypothetical protein [Plantactinospora endophytica]|uniref:Uncharacterized protein n=1 Tax=Plantactinospora endophytica TaxID=673535 RepID=A0ABQ4E870_9ACTN|nr:hypothetical protein [Plantactinospora endophytica]GIG90925.1 hypothetical protein Pen02_58610 [Plantactinospora endophytica]